MNIRTLAALAIGLAAAGAVSAQSTTLRAKIPFSFVVNGATLPAGEYTVQQANSAYTMIIKGIDHSVGTFTSVIPTWAPGNRLEDVRLVFNVYGDKYFLSEVWTATGQGSHVQPTRSERELMSHRYKPSQTVVAALH